MIATHKRNMLILNNCHVGLEVIAVPVNNWLEAGVGGGKKQVSLPQCALRHCRVSLNGLAGKASS